MGSGNREQGTVTASNKGRFGFSSSWLPGPGSRFTGGFTLLELVIVIAILSMVTMLVAPRLPSTDSSALRSSASALASSLRYLGESSVTGKTSYRMHLNISGNGLTITRKLLSGEEVPAGDTLLDRKILGSQVFITDVQTSRLGKVTEGEVLLDFNSAGLTEYVTIHLKAGSGKEVTVIGFPNSGKVKIMEGYQEYSL